MTVSPEAVELWRHIRAIQRRGDHNETDHLELRAAANELGRILGYDGILIEPHRVPADAGPGAGFPNRTTWRVGSLPSAWPTSSTPRSATARPRCALTLHVSSDEVIE
jgi:hypothetical protein